jgi:hypothetical protein
MSSASRSATTKRRSPRWPATAAASDEACAGREVVIVDGVEYGAYVAAVVELNAK